MQHSTCIRSPLRLPLLLLLATAFVAGPYCKEDSTVQDPDSVHRDPGQFAGTYSLEPSRTKHYIVLKKDGTAISERDGQREIGFVQRDSRMLRIYLQKKPVGLFLFDDYDANDWRGVWKDSVKILKRLQ